MDTHKIGRSLGGGMNITFMLLLKNIPKIFVFKNKFSLFYSIPPKDTPVLNIRELAQNSIEKTGPKRRNGLILIMFFTVIVVGLYLIFSKDISEIRPVISRVNQLLTNYNPVTDE